MCYGILSLTVRTPEPIERRIVDMFSANGTAVMTNVPRPAEPVYLAATPVRSSLVWAPTSGHIDMSLSIFSYRQEVTVGLTADAALVPDPEQIVAGLETELELPGRVEPGGVSPGGRLRLGRLGTEHDHPVGRIQQRLVALVPPHPVVLMIALADDLDDLAPPR